MGRRRTRPEKPRTYGVARGWRQRGVLEALLAGEHIGVLTHPGERQPSPPAGMTPRAWAEFSTRLALAGYCLTWDKETFGRWRYQLIEADYLAEQSTIGQ